MSVTVGSKGRAACVVNDQNTAAAVGSGLLPVFATPQMIALMENAAVDATQASLEEGQGTVGTRLDVSHDAATPVGMQVWAEAEVTAVDGRKLTFAVTGLRRGRPHRQGYPRALYHPERQVPGQGPGEKEGELICPSRRAGPVCGPEAMKTGFRNSAYPAPR